MSEPNTRRLHRLLQEANLLDADGLAVRVTAVDLVRREGTQQVRITYDVAPLPPGRAWQPLPRPDETLDVYVREVAEELHGWATEHVRRHRPLPKPDLDELARSLPNVEELWANLRRRFAYIEDRPDGGFIGTMDDEHVVIAFDANDWHAHVVRREIGARRDFGVDAAGAGDGAFLATWEVEELVGSARHHPVTLRFVNGRLRRG